MSNLEQLKQELIAQKTALEAKGATVTVANLNPSPAEITAGINSLSIVNTKNATATESDVLQGKTFYAMDNDIKTGTLVAMDINTVNQMFLFEEGQTSGNFSVTIPNSTTTLRSYIFYGTPHSMTVTLSENLVNVQDYAFSDNFNTTITNLHNCTRLEIVGRMAFQGCRGINLGALPMSINEIDAYAFDNTFHNSTELIVPPVTILQNYAFYSPTKAYLNNLDISRIQYPTMASHVFANLICDCDLVIPSTVTTIKAKSFNGFSAKHIVFPSSVTSIETNAFFVPTEDTEDVYNIIDFTFEGLTPPKFGSQFLGDVTKRSSVKVYVPDEAFDSYYNANFMTTYRSMLYPVSQKE